MGMVTMYIIIGVVSVCCCKEVYKCHHNNYDLSLLHLYYIALFCSSIPTSSIIFKCFFVLINNNMTNKSLKIVGFIRSLFSNFSHVGDHYIGSYVGL